jgi:hypothetical protein
MAQRLMWIMWPGFFMAIPAVGVVFSLFDPEDMHLMGAPVELGSLGAYSIGFLGIWLFGACCSVRRPRSTTLRTSNSAQHN